MITKVCSVCKVEKNTDDYHRRGAGWQPNCKECQNAINRARYKVHADKHIAHVRENKRARMQRFYAWKQTLKCSACPETFWKCLDFHHLDPTQKDADISDMIQCYGRDKVAAELAKCVVVCKNCHVKIHDGAIKVEELDIQPLVFP